MRFGDQVHVYSNYYLNTSNYGVAATEDSGVIVEGNYFENVDDPYHLGEASSGPGRLVARNNCLINSGAGETGGSVTNPPYSYTITTACEIKAVVTAQAGVGKVGLPGGPTNPPPPRPLPDHHSATEPAADRPDRLGHPERRHHRRRGRPDGHRLRRRGARRRPGVVLTADHPGAGRTHHAGQDERRPLQQDRARRR
ncbi:hypothetical protein GCM10027614_01870 [Micromonospora vulcania]